MPYDEVLRNISGPEGSKVSLGFVRADRYQEQHMHMHLRELMFHHKIVEIANLTRQHKSSSKPLMEQVSIGVCSRRDSLAAPPDPPAATSSSHPVDPPQRTPRIGADGEDLDTVRRELRRQTRPSTEELLEACAPARYPDRPAAATPRNANRPAAPGCDLFIDDGDGTGWASARVGEVRVEAGISASVGELAHGGRFQPLVIT
jgi:hypothetical protein